MPRTRSFDLSKGLKGHIFLTGLVGFVIYFVGFLIIFFIAGLAGGFGGQTLISQIILALGASALLPLAPVADDAVVLQMRAFGKRDQTSN